MVFTFQGKVYFGFSLGLAAKLNLTINFKKKQPENFMVQAYPLTCNF